MCAWFRIGSHKRPRHPLGTASTLRKRLCFWAVLRGKKAPTSSQSWRHPCITLILPPHSLPTVLVRTNANSPDRRTSPWPVRSSGDRELQLFVTRAFSLFHRATNPLGWLCSRACCTAYRLSIHERVARPKFSHRGSRSTPA